MKKKTFGTYIRRTLIALIFVVLLSVVGIFIFDRYDSAESSFTNAFDDDYWNVLEGFERYDELIAKEEKNNINSNQYELPYKETDTLAQKISATRYTEELDFLVKSIQDRYSAIEKEIETLKKVTTSDKAKWIFNLLGISESKNLETIYELVSSDPNPDVDGDEYIGTDTEFYTLLSNYKNRSLYHALVACGYSENLSTLINSVASGSDSTTLYNQAVDGGFDGSFEAWVVEVCGFNDYDVTEDYSVYNHLVLNGFTGTIDQWYAILGKPGEIFVEVSNIGYETYVGSLISDYDLYMSIYNDCGKADKLNPGEWIVRPAYDVSNKIDQNKIQKLEREALQLYDLINYAKEHSETNKLTKWSEYFNRYQLVEELCNDNFDFYFSYGLTTFKLVDKNSGYEWFSNPEEVNSALQIEQKTIISAIYTSSTGSEVGFSNYEYSVSTYDKNGRELIPNYAVKIINEGDKKAIQVWYRIEKRGINYSYFPEYLAETRLNELLERNAERAENGILDGSGKPVPNIITATEAYVDACEEINKLDANQADYETLLAEYEAIKRANKGGYDAYTKWFGAESSYYQLLSGESGSNEKGYNYYEYKGGAFENMSLLVVDNLYTWMYDWCGYTSADLVQDNTEFNVENIPNEIAFEVAIEYEITENGLKVTIPGNALREFGEYQLSKLDILPYFTATPNMIDGNVVDGYTIIPDGSGAIMEHNNEKANLYDPYVKRIYTTDLSEKSVTKKATNYDILLPMFSVVNTVEGVTSAVIVEATSMESQLELRATTSGYGALGENHNRHNFKAYLREGQIVKIGVYSKDPVQKMTDKLLTEDIVLECSFYSNATGSDYQNENIDYSFIAQRYRERIISKYGLENKVDTTATPVLDIDVIGAYTYEDNFLGIHYNAKGSMTTYKELKEMIDTYKENGVEYINIFYHGWRKEALVDVTFKKLKTHRILGSKKELEELAKESNVTIYPYVNLGEVNKYQENFGSNHYTTRDVVGEIITKKPYAINTNTYDPKGRKISVISPHYYYAFTQSLVDSYVKLFGEDVADANGVGINSISIDKFGSALAGDYKKNNEMYKTAAIREQLKSLDLVTENIQNLNLYTPYEYAFKYVTHAKDIPYESTQKELLDYSIPFYQLVVNGIFDYSSNSINANIESGLDYHVMKLIETGANPQFTFTYDSSSELIRTEYNSYYNTQYTEWLNEVKTIYSELKGLGIYAGTLVSHERISPNVYVVTYQVGNQQIRIGLNYSFSNIVVGTTTIAAKSYAVLQ